MEHKKHKRGNQIRDATSAPTRSLSTLFLSDWDCIPEGYTRLSQCPEVLMAVERIADLVSSMPLHVMENGDNGNQRVNDGLARKLDIEPSPWMTRKTLVSVLVRTLLLDGHGNAVAAVRTSGDDKTQFIESIHPIPPERVSFTPASPEGYKILIDGVPHDPSGLLHFVLNPSPSYPWQGTGYRVSLRGVVNALTQEAKTKAAFLSSKYNPALIVRVNALADTMDTQEGRAQLAKEYLYMSEPGEPWIVPADMMEVSQVKPLTLNDLALPDSVKLDRQSVAAILGVPPYLVGAGTFNRAEWNNFISATLMPLVRGLEQELTRKLIISPKRYVKFNAWGLYSYELDDLADIGANLYSHGLMPGNEVRKWLGLPPMEGLDNLVILENYIPVDKIGDQKKLKNLLNGGDDQ